MYYIKEKVEQFTKYCMIKKFRVHVQLKYNLLVYNKWLNVEIQVFVQCMLSVL